MIVDYEGYKFVYDPEIDFLMIHQCYENGCNCFNCTERFIDECIIDEISDELKENWEKTYKNGTI